MTSVLVAGQPIPFLRDLEQPADLFAFLAILIALSAYLATVRLFAIDRMQDQDAEKKRAIRVKLRLLVIPDAPMTCAAVCVGLYTLFPRWSPKWFLPAGIGLFSFAGFALLIFHVIAWYKTFFGHHSGQSYILLRQKVDDYPKWIEAFNKQSAKHTAKPRRIFHGDGKAVVLLEVKDPAKAKHFTESNEMKQISTAVGVAPPEVTLMTEVE